MIDGFPAGPICGLDGLLITAGEFGVAVYPDANNVSLRASGLAARYYVAVPQAVLVTRHGSSDLDFTMRAMVDRPEPDPTYLGGSCTLTTTLALPDTLVAQVIAALTGNTGSRPPDRLAALFDRAATEPSPVVQPVPVESTIIRCRMPSAQTPANPAVLKAQPSRTGPLNGPARTTILISSDPAATAAIVGNLRSGQAPFEVLTTLTEQFDTGPAEYEVQVSVDAGLLHAAYRDALPPQGPLTIAGDVPDAVHRAGLDSGAIRTDIRDVHGAAIDAALKDWIDSCDAIKATVAAAVKDMLFHPVTSDAPLPPARDWWDDVLVGATVALRTEAPAPHTTATSATILSGPLTTGRTVPADFGKLTAAATAGLDTYLLVIHLGAFS